MTQLQAGALVAKYRGEFSRAGFCIPCSIGAAVDRTSQEHPELDNGRPYDWPAVQARCGYRCSKNCGCGPLVKPAPVIQNWQDIERDIVPASREPGEDDE